MILKSEKRLEITAKQTDDYYEDLIGKNLEVTEIHMGQSNTSIAFKDVFGGFNSVHFDFYCDGKSIDIYRSALINPYSPLSAKLIYFEE